MKTSMVARNGGFAMSVSSMSALAQSFSQASGIQIGEIIRPVAKVCGAVLAAWLLFATYGLDLSAGFF